MDLKPVPREIVERTSDCVRQAKAYLTILPVEPETAIVALEDAVALWEWEPSPTAVVEPQATTRAEARKAQ